MPAWPWSGYFPQAEPHAEITSPEPPARPNGERGRSPLSPASGPAAGSQLGPYLILPGGYLDPSGCNLDGRGHTHPLTRDHPKTVDRGVGTSLSGAGPRSHDGRLAIHALLRLSVAGISGCRAHRSLDWAMGGRCCMEASDWVGSRGSSRRRVVWRHPLRGGAPAPGRLRGRSCVLVVQRGWSREHRSPRRLLKRLHSGFLPSATSRTARESQNNSAAAPLSSHPHNLVVAGENGRQVIASLVRR